MFHVKHALLPFALIMFQQTGYSQARVTIQNKPFSISTQRKDSIQELLSSNLHYNALSPLERDFFYWVNHLRSNPPLFARDFVLLYLEQFPEMENTSLWDLVKELSGMESLQLLIPDAALSSAAKKHGMDLANTGRSLTHIGSKGKDFATRMREIGNLKCASENLYEGRDQALEALIILLIDHGVPGYGHRKAILNPHFNRMGCSVVQRPEKGPFIFVQIFSCQ